MLTTVLIHVGACGLVDRALDSRSEGLGFDSQYWPRVEVLGKIRVPHCLGPPSHNWYLVHRSKVGSIVAGCIGAHFAKGKVKSVEYALSWSLDSKQLPLHLPFTRENISYTIEHIFGRSSTCMIQKYISDSTEEIHATIKQISTPSHLSPV